MTIVRLDHVNIQTGRFDESVRFYMAGLGLGRTPLPGPLGADGGEERGAWLCDAAGVAIVHLRRGDGASTTGGAAIDHFALSCEDYDGFIARLTDRGIGFEATDYPQIGMRQIVVHDPNDVKIELNFQG